MSTPGRVVEAMRDWGVDVRLYEPDGVAWWRHVTDGAFHPAGVMHHHTTGPRSLLSDADSIAATLRLLRRGRPGLPGPLCHGAPAMIPGSSRARVWMVGWANTNHAGTGSGRNLDLIRSGRYAGQRPGTDNTDGNPWFFGLEYCHPGDATRWPDALLEAGHRTGVAVCEAFGLSRPAGRQIEHKQWTNRKVDRSWSGNVRSAVAALVAEGNSVALTDAEIRRITESVWRGIQLGEVDQGTPSERLVRVVRIVDRTEPTINQLAADVAALRTSLAALRTQVDRLVANAADPAAIQAALDAGAANLRTQLDRIVIRVDVEPEGAPPP